jgi:hypothetical protein
LAEVVEGQRILLRTDDYKQWAVASGQLNQDRIKLRVFTTEVKEAHKGKALTVWSGAW